MERTPDLTVTTVLKRMEILEQALAEKQQEMDRLEEEAETDELTGLGNVRALKRRLQDHTHWVVMADLDGFKAAQDRHPHGHAYGDLILKEFASFLIRTTRHREDIVCLRKGGDEFIVLVGSRSAAREVRDRIRRWRGRGGVTASAGLGECTESADAAMYIDKERK